MDKDAGWAKLVETLRVLHRNRGATVEELRATLEMAQLAVEECWESRPIGELASCAHPGCNYRRYPASPFCMYHVTGKDTFAARLRRAIEKRDTSRISN